VREADSRPAKLIKESVGGVSVGITRTRHLTCPKCGGEFDYEFVPGGSFTAVRLGTSRFMRCPLCHKFSVFSLKAPPEGDVSAGTAAAEPPPG
jgi:hypothetical protein